MSPTLQKTKRWDIVSFILHLGIGLAVSLQLFTSLIMHRPYHGRVIPAYTANAFTLHRYIGLVAIGFLLAYWIWVLVFRRDKLSHLFPWSRLGWQKIRSDVACLCRFRLPENNIGGLPGLVHGLGLLLITAVGLIGTFLFFTLPDTKSMPPLIHTIKETHQYFAYWIWWYLVGHSFMALLHWIRDRRLSS